MLTVSHISKTVDGEKLLDDISFTVGHDDKIAFVGPNTKSTTMLFKILAGEEEPDEEVTSGVLQLHRIFP